MTGNHPAGSNSDHNKGQVMVEAPDRLHEALDRAKREITVREVLAMARFIARREVEQRWREQGDKRYDHSFKQLVEAGDALIRQKPELVGLARIALEGLRSSRTGAVETTRCVSTEPILVYETPPKTLWLG